MARTIEIKPLGNLANRMIQFLFAWKLQQDLGDAEISNPSLPEWGLGNQTAAQNGHVNTLVITRDNLASFRSLCLLARSEAVQRIVIDNYMQRIDCLPDRCTATALFASEKRSYVPREDEVLINVRSGELTNGIHHYPLVPADFYDRIIRLSGLRPVFMGQIDASAYCRQLRTRFPRAKFISSQGAIEDFQTVRKAQHIVVSVSTFSWLAAWLSNAKRIYLPMLGLFNPMSFGERKLVDLLPTDDPRYRFFMFPLHYGLPEDQAIRYHTALTEFCREVSPRQVDFLRTQAPLLKTERPGIDFDQVWYTHTYMQAAAEISEGWVAGPLEHYIEIGARRGYQPLPAGFSQLYSSIDNSLVDLSLDKPATQSSLSQQSIGATIEQDATRAVSLGQQAPYAFHTGYEVHPWWSVDLGELCSVRQVVLINRFETESIAARASPLLACSSVDGTKWSPLFRIPDGLIPGRDGKPLIWTASEPIHVRFVRLVVPRLSCLHLRQVRILGCRKQAEDPGSNGIK